MDITSPHPSPQPASGNTEDKPMPVILSSAAQVIPATSLAVDSGESDANKAVDTGIKRKRRTVKDMQSLKEAIAEDYKLGIPLKYIAKKRKIRIELVYKLFCNLQEEGNLPEQPVDYTIIETPDAFKDILEKFNHADTGLLKIEKNLDGISLVVSTFEV